MCVQQKKKVTAFKTAECKDAQYGKNQANCSFYFFLWVFWGGRCVCDCVKTKCNKCGTKSSYKTKKCIFKKCTQYILFKLIISLTWVCSWVLLMITEKKKKHYKIFIWVHSGIASNEVIFMQQPWQFTLDVHGLKLQAIMRLWGQWWKNQQKMKKNKRSRRGAGCPSLSKPGSFPVLSGLSDNGPAKWKA